MKSKMSTASTPSQASCIPRETTRYFRRPSGIWKFQPDGRAFCRNLESPEWFGSVMAIEDMAALSAEEIPATEGEP
jgi:hypothetical protein